MTTSNTKKGVYGHYDLGDAKSGDVHNGALGRTFNLPVDAILEYAVVSLYTTTALAGWGLIFSIYNVDGSGDPRGQSLVLSTLAFKEKGGYVSVNSDNPTRWNPVPIPLNFIEEIDRQPLRISGTGERWIRLYFQQPTSLTAGNYFLCLDSYGVSTTIERKFYLTNNGSDENKSWTHTETNFHVPNTFPSSATNVDYPATSNDGIPTMYIVYRKP